MTLGTLVMWSLWAVVAGVILYAFVKYGPEGDRWGKDRKG